MLLSKLRESINKQKLKYPNNFDGFAYKWIEYEGGNIQKKITKIPGYVSLTINQNYSFPIGLLYKISIPNNLLVYQPYEPYVAGPNSNYGYYDMNTTIKPGWLCKEMNDEIAEVAVITIPCDWFFIKIEKINMEKLNHS